GRWSPLIGWLAVGWVVGICILFVLPPAYPITISTFNYAPVAVLVVLIIATVSWQVGGKRTFMEGRDVEHTTKSLGAVLDE
ncbi:MAG TPA: amino acid permease, partial [Microlunatus sp.]